MMNRVKELRMEKGATANQLGTLIGVSTGTYWKKEAGVLRFSLVDAKVLADFYGESIESIFFAE